ncbi:MAG: M42 family metallopeptidase [Chloroflexi bacterium]|nr:M42 family metallopeptidase [Chloroflexota bacterium]
MNPLPAIDLDTLVDRLVQLLRTPSPTGDTEAALTTVAGWLREMPQVTPAFTRKGALIVTLPGRAASAPRAVTAHVDTLGAIVKEIKPSGRLVFDRIGGYPFFAVNGEYCTIATADGRRYTGTALLVKSSVHVHREPVKEKEWKIEEMEIRLDAAVNNAAETRSLGIEVGDPIAWDPRTVVTDTGYVKSRHLDDKAGVAVLLAALKALADTGATPTQRTTFHFSNFEEVGHGAAAGIPADVTELIAVDMGALGEGQQGDEHAVSICAKDSGGPYDLGLRRRLVALAKAHGIRYKLDLYPFYGSDAEAAVRAGGDYRIGLFGPGVDASHSFERTHRDALLASTQLLLAYLLDD